MGSYSLLARFWGFLLFVLTLIGALLVFCCFEDNALLCGIELIIRMSDLFVIAEEKGLISFGNVIGIVKNRFL